ncbi:MAG: PAS domain S-box protein [Bacteroidales bacterium]|nr:PAS domain S-box protein [Bacteroidales bacterium]
MQNIAFRDLDHAHKLLKYIIEHTRSCVAVHDRDMRYMYVSQRYLDEYKVKEKDVIGKHHYDVFPDLPQKWRDVHGKVLKGAVISAEDDPYEREDGSVDWTRWECRPWYEANGSIGGLIVYTEVINDRKRIEENLRVSFEKYKALFDSFPGGISVSNDKGEILESNKEAEILLGLSPAEIRQRKIDGVEWKIIRPNGTPMPADDYASVIAHKEQRRVENVEMGIVKGKGDITWIRVSATPIPLEGYGVLITYFDISERKRMEEELKLRESRFSNAVKLAKLGTWEMDVERGIFTFTDNFYDIFHTTAKQMGGYEMSLADYAKRFVHPEDSFMVAEETRKAIETSDPNFSHYVEHRIVYADGGLGFIAVRIFIVKDNFGKTIKTFGVNQDITDQKQAEQRLQENLNELERFNKIMVNRELKMVELKKEIARLKEEGRGKREEGRGKREEGRGKKEEGRGKRYEREKEETTREAE